MKLPNFLNSLSAIMVPMLILFAGFWIEASVLFFRAFEGSMTDVLRYPAASFMGFAVTSPLLLTAINSLLLPGFLVRGVKIGFPELFGVFTVMMVLLFFDAFGETVRPTSWYLLIGFIAVFLGLIDYLYAFLLVRKYREEVEQVDFKTKYNDLYAEVVQMEQAHQRTTDKLKEYHSALTEARRTLNETEMRLNEYRQALTCPHCQRESKTHSAHKNHVARCRVVGS